MKPDLPTPLPVIEDKKKTHMSTPTDYDSVIHKKDKSPPHGAVSALMGVSMCRFLSSCMGSGVGALAFSVDDPAKGAGLAA
jgi:hypothetical protein